MHAQDNPLHDDALVADDALIFVALERAISASDPSTGEAWDLEMVIDELVDELIEVAEAKMAERRGSAEPLEVALSLDAVAVSAPVSEVA